MAASHQLVTVCMFCLLCAAHTGCSAHSDVSSDDSDMKRLHDLRHERFKHVDAAAKVNFRLVGAAERGSKSNDEDAYIRRFSNDKNTLAKERVRLRRIKRALNVADDKYYKREIAKHEPFLHGDYMNKRYEGNDIKNNDVANEKNVANDGNDALRRFKRDDYSHEDFNDASRLDDTSLRSRLSNNGDDLTFVKDFTSSSEEESDVGSDAEKSVVKRDAHRLEENVDADSAPYRVSLKNIDVNFYIKKLFMQFGDSESMTMDLLGFERMLRKLNLDRMVLEAGQEKQQKAVEPVVNGFRSNSTNVTCVNSVDLISSLNVQQQYRNRHLDEHRHKMAATAPPNISLEALKEGVHLNQRTLSLVCPILLYQKVAETSNEMLGCVVEREFPARTHDHDDDQTDHHHGHEHGHTTPPSQSTGGMSNRTAVWTYSCLSILVISACGLLGVAVIPIMHHAYYQQILQFLVALAVGTLSGDAMLHLLPHAMSSSDPHEHHDESHDDSTNIWKGLVAMIAVVFFYFMEKGLTLVAEWRKRRMRRDKENKLPSRVRVMRNDIGCLKGSGSCSSHAGSCGFLKLPAGLNLLKNNTAATKPPQENNAVTASNKICKHKYSEYPYCYDEIASDTHDDHHVRDGRSNSKEPVVAKCDDGAALSVVSLSKSEVGRQEPDVNDFLLAEEDGNNAVVVGNSNSSSRKDHGKGANGDGGVDKMADLGTEMNKMEAAKDAAQVPDSYTVILREHSQPHHGHSHSHGHVHSPPSSLSSVVWMVIMGDGMHNFTDGMAIGAAFSSNIAGGFSTAIAVLCHELPHEIGDFAVLLKAGMSARRAVYYNLLSSLLCLLGMVVGVMVGAAPQATAWIFAAAAGMFLYIALVDMIPELSSSHSNEGGSLCQCLLQLSGLATGMGIMLLIAIYEHDLKNLIG